MEQPTTPACLPRSNSPSAHLHPRHSRAFSAPGKYARMPAGRTRGAIVVYVVPTKISHSPSPSSGETGHDKRRCTSCSMYVPCHHGSLHSIPQSVYVNQSLTSTTDSTYDEVASCYVSCPFFYPFFLIAVRVSFFLPTSTIFGIFSFLFFFSFQHLPTLFSLLFLSKLLSCFIPGTTHTRKTTPTTHG